MKKIVLFLILFYAKTVIAQPFTIGVTAGGLNYNFRQQSTFLNTSYYSLGLCGQYIFKDTGAWGIEANVYYYPSGVNYSTGYWDPYKGFASAEYLCFNPFHKYKGVVIQLKAGLFYASYDATSGLPQPDYGPAVGIYLGIIKITKHSYLGLDVNYMCGLQNYLIDGNVVSAGNPNAPNHLQAGNSDITNINFLLKYIYKIK